MGLYNALQVGVTGLNAQSSKIDSISTNISNSNTVGYKANVTSFSDLITSDAVVGYSPNGVMATHTSFNGAQGQILPTQSVTDLAIDGNGFFAVTPQANSTGALYYTRAGSFTPDKNGNLVNGAGYYLQAWPIDDKGDLPPGVAGASVNSAAARAAMVPVNTQGSTTDAVATTTASFQLTLDPSQAAYAGTVPYDPTLNISNMASGAIPYNFNVPVTVVDSTGANHELDVAFLKTGTNTWAAEVYAKPASDIAGGGNGQVAAGTFTFNGDGTLASISPSLSQPLNIAWQNGADPSSIAVDWGTAGPIDGTPGATTVGLSDGLSQSGNKFDIGDIQQNGFQAGSLTGIEILSDGYVVGQYSNNTSHNLFKIPLAQFVNPNQLNSISGNVFTETTDAGPPQFSTPGQNGIGDLDSSSLESSNAEVAGQLTDMLVAQSAYQFNTKLITTTDSMLQTLTQMLG